MKVLDKGYVLLLGCMGSDLEVVNAARASFEKRSEWALTSKGERFLADKDARLIRFLVEHGHMSPFRHCALSFEVKAPLMVARQWWKYHVASTHTEEQDGWNEASRRYVTSEPEFYIPAEWRAAPENKKQGSGGPVDDYLAGQLTRELEILIEQGERAYKNAIQRGIAPEQARMYLPAYAMYVTWRWTTSLEGVAHMLKQRLGHDAQWEFQQYAQAVNELAGKLFPVSLSALGNSG